MAVTNPHGLEVWVKHEHGDGVSKIGPEGWPDDQDGIAIPNERPGLVFKSVNGIDIEVQSDGSVKADGDLISDIGQFIKGGWMDKPLKDMDDAWDALFEHSKGDKKDEKKPKPAPQQNNTGGSEVSSSGRDSGHFSKPIEDHEKSLEGGGGCSVSVHGDTVNITCSKV